MVLIPVLYPHCQSDQVIKGGKTKASQPRYQGQNLDCPGCAFQLHLTDKGRSPEIQEPIIDMALNGSGSRGSARVLKISTATVTHELKNRVDTDLSEPDAAR